MKPPKDLTRFYDNQPIPLKYFAMGAKEKIGEKRAYARHNLPASLEISNINKDRKLEARLINYGEGGICIKSAVKYNSGMSLFVRVKDFSRNPSYYCLNKCPRSICLADVKWCQKVRDSDSSYFKMGLQFFAPIY
jgi:hypothetical protein